MGIQFKQVTKRYGGSASPLVVQGIDFVVPKGSLTTILGPSGCGKSTLIRSINRINDLVESARVVSGSIKIDGVDLYAPNVDVINLRRNVGMMLQETWLFSGSLRENIQMGYYEYEDAHILNVAKLAGVDDFVAGHPQGYDMMLRERGEGLSGGQRQAINLARALLHSPSLVIMDEPTSSLDTASEEALLKRLRVWLDGRTTRAAMAYPGPLPRHPYGPVSSQQPGSNTSTNLPA